MSGPRWVWLAAWFVLIVADAATTEVGISTGAASEANPAGAWILANFGLRALVLSGAAASTIVASAPLLPWPTVLLRRAVWTAAALALVGKAAVVASNLVQLANA